jgi:hypothetical protein
LSEEEEGAVEDREDGVGQKQEQDEAQEDGQAGSRGSGRGAHGKRWRL